MEENKKYQITEKGMLFCEVYETKEISKYLLLISTINLIINLIQMILMLR